MAYLVTGGTGFIGSYVVRDLLHKGKEVVCFQRSATTPLFQDVVPEQDMRKVRIVQGSVDDAVCLFHTVRENNIEVIVHLAYLLGPESQRQPELALKINCLGWSNIFEAARLFGVRRIVWTSSANVFGRLGESVKEAVKDNALHDPVTLYGATKALNEFMAQLYFQRFKVDSIGLRPGRVYGAGKMTVGDREFSAILQKAPLDLPVTIHYADVGWHCVYVEDLSRLIILACEAPPTKTRVFNVSDGAYYNGWQLAEVVQKINPKANVTVEATSGWLYYWPRVDISAVKEELGWQPEYSLEQGLKKIFNYYRHREGMPPL